MNLEERKLLLPKDVKNALDKVGVQKGQSIMVHTSLSSLGYVCGGAQTIIEKLIESVGEEGTIMMPTQSWKNLDPETGVYWLEPKEWWDTIRENIPAYDKKITPTNTMGAVAEMFRQWPGTLRSDHPARSVAAWGRYAKYLTENHDLSNIFGEGSPIGKLYELDGYVLLIGVGYDKNTSLHLADVRAKYEGKHNVTESSAMMIDGKRVWKSYETLAVDGEDFEAIGEAFDQTGKTKKIPLGNSEIILMRQRDVVDFAIKWIEENRVINNYYEQAKVCVKDYVLPKQHELYEKCGKNFDRLYELGFGDEMYTTKIIEPGKVYELGYRKCTCQKVLSGEIDDPRQCECSRQSILYILEQIEPNASFEVELLESVLRGNDMCKFRITVNRK